MVFRFPQNTKKKTETEIGTQQNKGLYLEVVQSAGVWSDTPPAHLSHQVLLLSGRHLLKISVDWKSSSLQLSDEVSSVYELSAERRILELSPPGPQSANDER